jgi:hypothetical protein
VRAFQANSVYDCVVKSLLAMLREFAWGIAMAVRQLREQLQREIDDERNPPYGRA